MIPPPKLDTRRKRQF